MFSSAPPYKFWKEPFLDLYLATNYVAADINPWRMHVAQVDHQNREQYVNLPKLSNGPTIVLIIVDSLRADHLELYGYHRPTSPFLTQLHAQGQVRKVDVALSTCPNTYCGVLSIMASKPFRDISYENFKLYDLLHILGYKVNFIVSGDHLGWYNMGKAYGTNIDLFFDYRNTRLSPNDDVVLMEGLDHIPLYDGKPSFFYFHLMSVHTVGVSKEQYNMYFPVSLHSGSQRQVRINRYDNSIIQADAYIKNIFAKLMELGYLENSLVVVTSDHGENLGEDGDLPDHGWNLRQHQISIPMLIYDTGKSEFQDLSFARQVDIAPTIADRLDVPIPSIWWGTSLYKYTAEKCSYHQSVKGDPSYAVVCRIDSKIYKYILRQHKFSSENVEQLYELLSDPKEVKNLVTMENTNLVDYFRKQMREHLKAKKRS
jgi:glucan phosphoethanolaminetransferase (alkaline phosphatase superfamily)